MLPSQDIKVGLRQDILDAARELFVKQGYEGVSMRKIAHEIKYSPTAIYLHFRDKQELFDCLAAEGFSKLLEQLQSIGGPESGDPVEALRRSLHAYVDFGLRNPDLYKITFLMQVDFPAEGGGTSKRHEIGCQAFQNLQMSVEACIQAGRFRVSDRGLASELLWAGVHGVVSLLIVHPAFPWQNRNVLVNTMIDTLLEGVRK